MQIYPHKAKINANIASIYAIINPKNAPERPQGHLIGLLYLASIPCYHFTKSLGRIPNCFWKHLVK